ncbi:member of the inositol monophosphatase protein family, partial [Thalassiosira pseudonana CCMP1335]
MTSSNSILSMEELVSFANILADAARTVILPFWRQPIEVESKMEHDRPIAESPVTVADRMAEEAMRKLIEEKYPAHGICGEEHGNVRMDAEYVWVLDPIDGTKSFITGKPLFGTLIACLRDGEPIIGVIDQCVLKERWVGVVGSGTTFNGEPVTTTAGCTELKESMMYATSPHMFGDGEEAHKFKEMCDRVKRPLYGADCYAYAIVASGFGADIVVEADLGLYDYCALVPIVEGSGGVMTDWFGRRLTLANHETSKGRVVACANADLHKEAVAIL